MIFLGLRFNLQNTAFATIKRLCISTEKKHLVDKSVVAFETNTINLKRCKELLLGCDF